MSIGKTLQVLADLLKDLPPDEPLTAGKAYMGEDL